MDEMTSRRVAALTRQVISTKSESTQSAEILSQSEELAHASYPRLRHRAITVVRTLADFDELCAGRLGPRHRPLRLELPGLGDDEARQLASRLMSLRSECDCSIGAWLTIAAIATGVAWLLLIDPTKFVRFPARIGVAVAMIIVTGAAGKAPGIARARRAMAREIDALQDRIAGI